MRIDALQAEMVYQNPDHAEEIPGITSYCFASDQVFGEAEFLLMTENLSRCFHGPCDRCRCTDPIPFVDRRVETTTTTSTTTALQWNACRQQLFNICRVKHQMSYEHCMDA